MADPGGADFSPMLAKQADLLPASAGWRFEPKWDGYRAIVRIDTSGRVRVLSRRGTDLTGAFPEIAAAAEGVPAGTIVDGEIIRWSTGGRLDFEALQRRNRAGVQGARKLARTEPCHLVVFDVLRALGTDLTRVPLAQRRQVLEELIPDEGAGSSLVLGMQTDDVDVARAWAQEFAVIGVEGIVAKRADQAYLAGVRGWLKIKSYTTTEVIVGGVTGSLEHPESLILGRIRSADGQLRIAGRSTDLHEAESAAIAAVIEAAGDDHPWPAQLPPSWHDREARDYIRLVPAVVAEVRVDVATSAAGGPSDHWRHRLRYLRIRSDLTPSDVPKDLLTEE